MNILFFLLPKKNVEYVLNTFTIRQTLEKMEYHHYTAVPILDNQGKYVNTISAEDLLFCLKDNKFNYQETMQVKIESIKPLRDIKAITIDKQMDELIDLVTNQNFVPVVDDNNYFIGIITRKSVITFFQEQFKKQQMILNQNNHDE